MPGFRDAWVTGLRIELVRYKNLSPGFVQVDTALPTIRNDFLDPLRMVCEAENARLPTAAALISRIGATISPSPASDGHSPEDGGVKQPLTPNPSGGGSADVSRTDFVWPGRMFLGTNIVISESDEPTRFNVGLSLLDSPLSPTVAELAAALDGEKLFQGHDASAVTGVQDTRRR